MLLEIVDSRLKMYYNFGSGVQILELDKEVDDNREHYLAMRWTNDTIQMDLDRQSCSNDRNSGLR